MQTPDALIASSFIFPAGKAKRTDGGYLLSGRWPFSSGVDQSSWNMLAGLVGETKNGGPPEARIFLLPERDYEVIDTWYAAGLRGTGSKDVACADVFVPEAWTVAAAALRDGVARARRSIPVRSTGFLPLRCFPTSWPAWRWARRKGRSKLYRRHRRAGR